MAFTGNFMATSFKREILEGVHNFSDSGGDTFKLALYTNDASFTAATTAYTTTNEVAASGSYAAGGGALTNNGVATSGTTAFADFEDLSFTSATITARGALLYNDTVVGDPVALVLDFGSDRTSTDGTFTVQFPTPDASSAILRIA